MHRRMAADLAAPVALRAGDDRLDVLGAVARRDEHDVAGRDDHEVLDAERRHHAVLGAEIASS